MNRASANKAAEQGFGRKREQDPGLLSSSSFYLSIFTGPSALARNNVQP